MGRKRYMLAYKATNKIDGKCYVGQTTFTLASRKAGHKRKALKLNKPSPFYRAIREYGWDNFTWETVGICNSQQELDQLEAKAIEGLGDKCYNSSTGGRSDYHISEAHKEIVRKNMLGKNNPMYGNKLSKEQKEKLLKASMEVCEKPVMNIETKEIYPSISECARQEGYSIATISLHCNGKIRTQRYKFL